MSFKDFLKDCEKLTDKEIFAKIFIWKERDIENLDYDYSSRIKMMSKIFEDPEKISFYYKNNQVIVTDLIPIISKMESKSVREFLQENFPEKS